MKSLDDTIRCLVAAMTMTAVVKHAPRFLQQFHAIRAMIEAQPSPATYYLNRWHNR